MMFNLAALTRRAKNPRRTSIPIRPIVPTGAIAADLAALYRPFLDVWAHAADRLSTTYTVPTADALTLDAPSDAQGILDEAASAITRLLLILTPRMRDWALRTERWHRTRWIGAVLAATSVQLDTMLTYTDVHETVEAFVARNVALVKDVSAQAQARMSEAVFRGFTLGTPPREVAKDLQEAVALGRKRAIRIASDQSTKLASALDSERMKQAGIETWLWRWSHKKHGRPEHIARDGHRYTWKTAPQDMPGELPFCGCRKQAVVDLG